jgi:nucleotide-binding universal stress UspA family protein
MFERILVPLDGSERAETILVQIRRVLTHQDAEILLLQVVPPGRRSRDGAADYLASVTRKLVSEGANVREKVAEGLPAECILRTAEMEKATLLALSTHGRTGDPRWRFGSVTEKLLRSSPVPVLAMPSFARKGKELVPTGTRERPIRTILAPIAESDLSLQILPAIGAVAELFGSQVILLNVCEPGGRADPVPQMRAAYDWLKEKGVAAEPVVVRGDPALQILEASRERGVDLIALTTHARSGLSRWMMGSVAEKLVHATPVPLLVVRPARRPAKSKENGPLEIPSRR